MKTFKRRTMQPGMTNRSYETFMVPPVYRHFVTGIHLSLLIGAYDPFLAPVVPPLVALMTEQSRRSAAVESHARSAFNFAFVYAMIYAAVTAVCLVTGVVDDMYDRSIWQLVPTAWFIIFVLRSASLVRKGHSKPYPLIPRLLQHNSERSFVDRD